MILLDHDKVLIQVWKASFNTTDTITKLKQSGKLLSELPPDCFLWVGTADELKATLKRIEEFSYGDKEQPHRM